MSLRLSRSAAAALALALASAACGSDTGPNGGTSQVRVVHAAAQIQPITVRVGSTQVADGLAYASVAPGGGATYLAAEAGNVRLRIEVGASTVLNADIPLNDGTKYTIHAVRGINFEPTVTALVTVDAGTAPAAGSIGIRAVHFFTAGADVFIAPVGQPLPGTPTIDNVLFRNASSYVDLAPGTYRVCFGGEDLCATLPALAAGAQVTVVGIPDPTEVTDGSTLVLTDRTPS